MAKKKTDKKAIREAVIRNHGGFEDATDSQIAELWKSLPEEIRQRYLGQTGIPASAKATAGRPENRNEVTDADSVRS